MRVLHFKSINLCLVMLLCFFYFNGSISAWGGLSRDAKDDALENYAGHYMLHFSDYYKPLDNTESVNDVVNIKFVKFNFDKKKTLYLDYRLGDYSDIERLYVDLLSVPADREKRSRMQHEMMFIHLACRLGYAQEHSIPIGGCKIMYSGSLIYSSIAAIAFYDKTDTDPKVCICFVGNCSVKSVREECDQKSIRCKNVLQTVDPPPFCSAFNPVNIVSITPLSFSKQNFFKSGAKLRIRSGLAKPYEMDLYAKSYKVGEKTLYNITYLGTSYEFRVYKVGYDMTCVEYTDNGVPGKTVCVPSPELVRPKVVANYGNNIRIEYQDCEQPSICSVDVPVGTKDQDLFFSVIKPKINLKDYTLISQYECSNGQIVEDSSQCADGTARRLGYAHDDRGNVVCVVDMPFAPMKYSLRKNHRNFWLSTHKKMLWGYGVVSEKTQNGKNSERYEKCNYDSAVDIRSMTQDQLDEVKSIKSDLFFDIAGHYNPKMQACQGNALYKYEDTRLYEKNKQHTCKGVVKWNNGVRNFESCRSFYVSDDNFTNFFHDDDDKDKIKPLNPILQGMCISNFPSYEYKVRALKRKVLPNTYKLSIDEKKTVCDFLKIEAWGGGASGISRSGKSGRPGSYVMGLLRLSEDMMKKKLIVDVGPGGKGRHNYLSHSGGDTSVKLCNDEYGKDCIIELVAQGGHAMGSYLKDVSKGIEYLTHYRFASGMNQSERNEILVPYQGVNLPYGGIQKGDNECVDSSNKLEKNANKYPGAGGCSSIYNSAQEGADGMVKLTCEKWSDLVGRIVLKDENECDDSIVMVIEKINHSTDYLPQEVRGFLSKISKPNFCQKLKLFPHVIVSISEYLSALKKVLHDKASLAHNLPAHRKKLLTELNNVRLQTALKSIGINDSPERLLLYIDALIFNLGVNIVSPPEGLLNYYVLDDKSESVDQLVSSDVGYAESDKIGSIFSIVDEEFNKRDFFSVELENQQFRTEYKDFINMIHRGVITEQSGYKKNNIVVSWMYIFYQYDRETFQLYAEPFVKLMLGINLVRYTKSKKLWKRNVCFIGKNESI
ncbi:MAG: entry-triggering protein EtpE [Ehrlichia sp.]